MLTKLPIVTVNDSFPGYGGQSAGVTCVPNPPDPGSLPPGGYPVVVPGNSGVDGDGCYAVIWITCTGVYDPVHPTGCATTLKQVCPP